MKTFQCTRCKHGIFFENTLCVSCGGTVGYLPQRQAMATFEPVSADVWRIVGPDSDDGGGGRDAAGEENCWRPCLNYSQEGICNWMVPLDDPVVLCSCCRHTEVIPSLDKPKNHGYWALLEAAKRRLYYGLDALGLARPGLAEDPVCGIRFHFLEDQADLPGILTGHDSGLITLNVAEADDALREARRTALGEPSRTLLGHFRHEVGHFYWDKLIANSDLLVHFRQYFGDETLDYDAALRRHYQLGPPADWNQSYITAYASCHPWEDWAETWAHYLQVVDALETAMHWRIHIDGNDGLVAGLDPVVAAKLPFRERLMHTWLPVSRFLNSMSRSLGQRDSYPFTFSLPVIDKLEFVDRVVSSAAGLDWQAWPSLAASFPQPAAADFTPAGRSRSGRRARRP